MVKRPVKVLSAAVLETKRMPNIGPVLTSIK
jgi:hypothetical protein